ncbi:MAG: CBS domain-containing protein [Acidobacteriaceae bacterium]|nr:CBS domain-containing protein [Acidobacteriaceae bacterium]
MTLNPAYCVPDDNVVRAAMLMKQYDVGSIPVVKDRGGMELVGIVTDRDLVLRVVAEQRDYYQTHISDVMTADLVTCYMDDDSDDVLNAMAKRQLRRIPVVDKQERLVGIISQADVARQTRPQELAESIRAISEPNPLHPTGLNRTHVGLMVAGGVGLGASLWYLLNNPSHAEQEY